MGSLHAHRNTQISTKARYRRLQRKTLLSFIYMEPTVLLLNSLLSKL